MVCQAVIPVQYKPEGVKHLYVGGAECDEILEEVEGGIGDIVAGLAGCRFVDSSEVGGSEGGGAEGGAGGRRRRGRQLATAGVRGLKDASSDLSALGGGGAAAGLLGGAGGIVSSLHLHNVTYKNGVNESAVLRVHVGEAVGGDGQCSMCESKGVVLEGPSAAGCVGSGSASCQSVEQEVGAGVEDPEVALARALVDRQDDDGRLPGTHLLVASVYVACPDKQRQPQWLAMDSGCGVSVDEVRAALLSALNRTTTARAIRTTVTRDNGATRFARHWGLDTMADPIAEERSPDPGDASGCAGSVRFLVYMASYSDQDFKPLSVRHPLPPWLTADRQPQNQVLLARTLGDSRACGADALLMMSWWSLLACLCVRTR